MKMNPVAFFLPALLSLLLAMAGAQPGPPGTNNNEYTYRFSPPMAIIIVVLIAALFFMGLFSIYIRQCSGNPSARGRIGSIRRALSRRAAARGLDAAVLDTFPTFTYAEVREHKMGKGALECAVCLNEFDPDDTLRLITKCDHVFHCDCIDAWLDAHVTCPVCRADLVPDQAASNPASIATPQGPQPPATSHPETRSDSDQTIVQIDEVSSGSRAQRSSSLASARVIFGFGRFRSYSTGHSVRAVQPGENLERFTLRLPELVRKEFIDRASLNRTGSFAVTALPRGWSTRSNRVRSYRRVEPRDGRSDRWLFFSRGPSTKSPKVVAEAGEASGSGAHTTAKMPSFRCLEPKAADEAGLFSREPAASSSG